MARVSGTPGGPPLYDASEDYKEAITSQRREKCTFTIVLEEQDKMFPPAVLAEQFLDAPSLSPVRRRPAATAYPPH